ncbi:MAG: hypothetical protein H6562_11375 [Lewinellaceae bacterium]|nr:hypothetical protein [Lewinella sp.]MCB9279509.1 hypothetical protein [Lewinellaceae bacterium]
MNKIKIDKTDKLLRRVQFLNPAFIKPDGSPASSSFQLKKDESGLSVDIERLTNYPKAIQDVSRFRLFSLDAAFTEGLGLVNEHDPLEDNYAHALIRGNISKSISRKMAQASKRIPFPD